MLHKIALGASQLDHQANSRVDPWWRLYGRECRVFSPETKGGKPPTEIKVGDYVRLRGKPEMIGKVLSIEWHGYRNRYCYRVETQASLSGEHCPAYWFSEQLENVSKQSLTLKSTWLFHLDLRDFLARFVVDILVRCTMRSQRRSHLIKLQRQLSCFYLFRLYYG
ncbi:hypothetical protein BJP34_13940 [Moorena producens PAL-8-15-08-1]|uniref:Uncharacterized protein n=1 Tax=Moorena producens PAL-8-15-08-1 TaxID=1458985 RepID=A0A1D8TRZ9_9CYAN|nr:hypothetical protein [Moorena producens]AOX00409.1 hypothetical protein BJP34_13940 [Moorena producens PAL-8-15-08-1]